VLCYEEAEAPGRQPRVHLQKAAPKHWFAEGRHIAVERCPTRFGTVSWRTEARGGGWRVTLTLPARFAAEVRVHVHPPDGRRLQAASTGRIEPDGVTLPAGALGDGGQLTIDLR
jgi:hypothetical protein